MREDDALGFQPIIVFTADFGSRLVFLHVNRRSRGICPSGCCTPASLETAGQRCGGMNEQLVTGATDARHPGREWHLGLRRSEANNWAINKPYLLHHPLERIERWVSRIARLLTRASPEHSFAAVLGPCCFRWKEAMPDHFALPLRR